MTDQEWHTIALLLQGGWKGAFGSEQDRAYRTLLDGYEPGQIVRALRELLANGTPFLPSVSEIVQTIRADPDRPTFQEAYHLIFDKVLWKRPDAAARELAWSLHPLLGRFVDMYGIGRLRMLEVEHEEHGRLVRLDLERAWDRFAEANEHRSARELAEGRRPRLERGPRPVAAALVDLIGPGKGEEPHGDRD